jgi:hypothetical protein
LTTTTLPAKSALLTGFPAESVPETTTGSPRLPAGSSITDPSPAT